MITHQELTDMMSGQATRLTIMEIIKQQIPMCDMMSEMQSDWQ